MCVIVCVCVCVCCNMHMLQASRLPSNSVLQAYILVYYKPNIYAYITSLALRAILRTVAIFFSMLNIYEDILTKAVSKAN